MGTTIHVEAARIPDRDRLVRELEASGLEARPVDEVGIEVPYDEGAEAEVAEDVYSQVQDLIMSIGAPFVPIKHEGVIYIRPPVG
jgi:hypothetical protein